MTDREKLIERLREIASLTPPICQYDRPIELDVMGKKITVYCKPFEQFQDLLREAADALANGVVVRERGEWEIIRDDAGNELMRCPVCREEFYDGDNDTIDHTPNFCLNCGADMTGAENDG